MIVPFLSWSVLIWMAVYLMESKHRPHASRGVIRISMLIVFTIQVGRELIRCFLFPRKIMFRPNFLKEKYRRPHGEVRIDGSYFRKTKWGDIGTSPESDEATTSRIRKRALVSSWSRKLVTAVKNMLLFHKKKENLIFVLSCKSFIAISLGISRLVKYKTICTA